MATIARPAKSLSIRELEVVLKAIHALKSHSALRLKAKFDMKLDEEDPIDFEAIRKIVARRLHENNTDVYLLSQEEINEALQPHVGKWDFASANEITTPGDEDEDDENAEFNAAINKVMNKNYLQFCVTAIGLDYYIDREPSLAYEKLWGEIKATLKIAASMGFEAVDLFLLSTDRQDQIHTELMRKIGSPEYQRAYAQRVIGAYSQMVDPDKIAIELFGVALASFDPINDDDEQKSRRKVVNKLLANFGDTSALEELESEDQESFEELKNELKADLVPRLNQAFFSYSKGLNEWTEDEVRRIWPTA